MRPARCVQCVQWDVGWVRPTVRWTHHHTHRRVCPVSAPRPRRKRPDYTPCTEGVVHVFRPGEGACTTCGLRVAQDAPPPRWAVPLRDVDQPMPYRLNATTLEPEDWPYEDL